MDNAVFEQNREPLVNYLRVHRRNAYLTQSEIGTVLGYGNDVAVSRHERFETVPPFLMALGYEILFREPAGEIFLGLKQAMEPGIEERLAALEEQLREQLAAKPNSAIVARKLEWVIERRRSESPSARQP